MKLIARTKRKNKEFKSTRSKYLIITANYLIPIAIIVGTIALLLIVFKTNILSIKQIYCQHDYQDCNLPHLQAELSKYLGINILKFDSLELKNKIIANNKTIKQVVISKQLPGTISINLISTSPKVAIKIQNGELQWIVLDSNFRVIKVVRKDPNLPTVLVNDVIKIQIGQEIDSDDIQKSLELATEISDNFFSVVSIQLEGDLITLILPSKITVFLTTKKGLHSQLKTLQDILADAKISSAVRTIDVRFTQPVIKSE